MKNPYAEKKNDYYAKLTFFTLFFLMTFIVIYLIITIMGEKNKRKDVKRNFRNMEIITEN